MNEKGEFEGVRGVLQLAELFLLQYKDFAGNRLQKPWYHRSAAMMIVVFVFKCGLDHVPGPILQPMLANDDGPALTGFPRISAEAKFRYA